MLRLPLHRSIVLSLLLGAAPTSALAASSPQDLDGDGLTNAEEAELETDPEDRDSDDDGLTDLWEVRAYGTDPNAADSDDDTLDDGDEVLGFGTDPTDLDTDDDGLPDGQEIFAYDTDPHDADTDGDGLKDGDELFVLRFNPLVADTDDNDTVDGDEDDDGDRLTNAQELYETGTDPLVADSDEDGTVDGDEDADGDGLDTVGELEADTDLDDADSDGDGLDDGPEVLTHLTSPLDGDSDSDGLGDAEEVDAETNPNDADSDDDGLIDGDEPRWDDNVDDDALINALDPDSDGDGLTDGTEAGVFEAHPDTTVDLGFFTPDADKGRSTTDPLRVDSDRGGVPDGEEDKNADGRVDDGETDATDFFDDGVNVLSRVEAIGLDDERCPQGGQAIHVGFDSGRGDGIAANGILEDDEVDTTNVLCHGVDGLQALVVATPVPIGSPDCELGGDRIDSGLDLDRDGELDPEEVTETAFLCAPKAEVGGWGGGGCAGGAGLGGLGLGVFGLLAARAGRGGRKGQG
jgi:hypothetical protein